MPLSVSHIDVSWKFVMMPCIPCEVEFAMMVPMLTSTRACAIFGKINALMKSHVSLARAYNHIYHFCLLFLNFELESIRIYVICSITTINDLWYRSLSQNGNLYWQRKRVARRRLLNTPENWDPVLIILVRAYYVWYNLLFNTAWYWSLRAISKSTRL